MAAIGDTSTPVYVNEQGIVKPCEDVAGGSSFPDFDVANKKTLATNAIIPDNGYIVWKSSGTKEAYLDIKTSVSATAVRIASISHLSPETDVVPVTAGNIIVFDGMVNSDSTETVDFFPSKSNMSLSGATVTLSQTSYNVSGVAPHSYDIKPTVTSVISKGTTLVEDTDYTVEYVDLADTIEYGLIETRTGYVKITGIGKYTDVKTVNVAVNINVTAAISGATATLAAPTAGVTLSDYLSVTGTAPKDYECKPVPTVELGDHTLTVDDDYTVTYSDNASGTIEEASTTTIHASVTITGTGQYTGTKVINYDIAVNVVAATKSITGVTIQDIDDATISTTTYTHQPDPTVLDGTNELTKDVDYTLTYSDNSSGTVTAPCVDKIKCTMTLTGKGNYTGTTTKDYYIQFAVKKSAADLTVTFDGSSQTITGTAPKTYDLSSGVTNIVVKDGDTTLTKDTDYTVSYEDCTGTISSPGTGTVTGKLKISGAGDKYNGEQEKTITGSYTVTNASEFTFQDVRQRMDDLTDADVITLVPVDTTTYGTTYWELVDRNHVDTVPVEFTGTKWYTNYKYYTYISGVYTEVDTTTYTTPAAAKSGLGVTKLYCKSTKNITLQMKNVLSDASGNAITKVFDSSSQLWSACSLRTWLNNDFVTNVLGTNVAACSNVNVETYTAEEVKGTTVDRVWLPSVYEVSGGISVNCWGKEGPLLDKYNLSDETQLIETRIKKDNNGDNSDYWLRSAYSDSENSVWDVFSSGDLSADIVSNTNDGISPLITLTY